MRRFAANALLLFSLTLFTAVDFARSQSLPDGVDLRPEFSAHNLECRNQGGRNTCSLFAITAVAEFELARQTGKSRVLSEEFLVWAANKSTGLVGDQAMFYEAVHGLNTLGSCAAPLMAYQNAEDSARTPSSEAEMDARPQSNRWLPHWIKLWDLTSPLTRGQLSHIKSALVQKHPVACGLRWPKAQSGWKILEVPESSEVFDGHSIVFVGYTNDSGFPGGGAFLFRNSFGKNWGDGGYGWMSFAYVTACANDALWLELRPPFSPKDFQTFEAEDLVVAAQTNVTTTVQPMNSWGAGMWGNGKQLFCRTERDGFIEFTIPVAKSGLYEVRLRATTAPDYGILRVDVDGKTAVPGVDLYSGRVSPTGSIRLGRLTLKKGNHRLRCAVIGKHSASRGYAFGIDEVELITEKADRTNLKTRPVRGRI
jgi:hypothetical protein